MCISYCLVQVVDVGGGTGFCTQGIVKSVPAHNVTLIDQSPHQLAKAKQKPDLQSATIVEVRRTARLRGCFLVVQPLLFGTSGCLSNNLAA